MSIFKGWCQFVSIVGQKMNTWEKENVASLLYLIFLVSFHLLVGSVWGRIVLVRMQESMEVKQIFASYHTSILSVSSSEKLSLFLTNAWSCFLLPLPSASPQEGSRELMCPGGDGDDSQPCIILLTTHCSLVPTDLCLAGLICTPALHSLV